MKFTKKETARGYMRLDVLVSEYNSITRQLADDEIDPAEAADKKQMLFEMIESIQDTFEFDLDTDYEYEPGTEDFDESLDYLELPDYEQAEYDRLMKELWAA